MTTLLWVIAAFVAGYLVCYFQHDVIGKRALREETDRAKEQERHADLMALALAYYDREGTEHGGTPVTQRGCVYYLILFHRVDNKKADEIASLALDAHLKNNPLIPPLNPGALGN